MSEFGENRWSVMSVRGLEAASLSYESARELVRQLTSEKVHGISIISDDAGRRLAQNQSIKVK